MACLESSDKSYEKNFYFIGCNLMRNNAFFVHKDYIKNFNLDVTDLKI